MNRTVFKPLDEINVILENYERVAILSCGTCAMLCGTGGSAGIRQLKTWVRELNKKTVFARCLIACCPQEIMCQAMKIYKKQISKSDVLVIMSCAAGLKSAFLCNPPVPVVTVLDSVGSAVITRDEDPVAMSLCKGCGSCVINHTAGICPLSHCPSKMKYGPCSRAPRGRGPCVADPGLECIWAIISERGCDMETLQRIKNIQKQKDQNRPLPIIKKRTPGIIRKFLGLSAARSQLLEKFIKLID